jgi:hypothetical protein
LLWCADYKGEFMLADDHRLRQSLPADVRGAVETKPATPKVPADLYTRSPCMYRGLEDVTYPFADATFTVTHCGRICFPTSSRDRTSASPKWATASGS